MTTKQVIPLSVSSEAVLLLSRRKLFVDPHPGLDVLSTSECQLRVPTQRTETRSHRTNFLERTIAMKTSVSVVFPVRIPFSVAWELPTSKVDVTNATSRPIWRLNVVELLKVEFCANSLSESVPVLTNTYLGEARVQT